MNGLRALGSHWSAWFYSPEWWRRETYITARGLTLDEQIKSHENAFIKADANDLLSQAMTWQAHDISTLGDRGQRHILVVSHSAQDHFFQKILRLIERFVSALPLAPAVGQVREVNDEATFARRFQNHRPCFRASIRHCLPRYEKSSGRNPSCFNIPCIKPRLRSPLPVGT